MSQLQLQWSPNRALSPNQIKHDKPATFKSPIKLNRIIPRINLAEKLTTRFAISLVLEAAINTEQYSGFDISNN